MAKVRLKRDVPHLGKIGDSFWVKEVKKDGVVIMIGMESFSLENHEFEFQIPQTALETQQGSNHYKSLSIQPIEYIHANNLGFMEGNVVKYITRHQAKNKADDIRKVIHYCAVDRDWESDL